MEPNSIQNLLLSLNRKKLSVQLHQLVNTKVVQKQQYTPIKIKLENTPAGACSFCGFVGELWSQVLEPDLKVLVSSDFAKYSASVPLCSSCSNVVTQIGKLCSAYNVAKAEFEDYFAGVKAVLNLRSRKSNRNEAGGECDEDLTIEFHNVKHEEDDNITNPLQRRELSNSKSPIEKTSGRDASKTYRSNCDNCGRHFQSTTGLFMHEQNNVCKKVFPIGSRGKLPKICYFCGVNSNNISYLAVHLRKHTMEYPTLGCGKCGKEYRDELAFVHHNITCGTSPEQFQHLPKKLIRKIQNEMERASRRKKTNQCPECHKTYTTRGNLLVHYRTICGKVSGQKLKQRRSSKSLKDGRFQCDICLKSCKYRRELLFHKKEGICQMRMLRKSKQRICYFCGFKSCNINALARHLWQHTKEYPSYECRKCKKVYRDEYTFVQHSAACVAPDEQQDMRHNMMVRIVKKRKQIAQEGSDAEHKCPKCDKFYRTKKSLAVHMKSKCRSDGSNLCEIRKRYRDSYYAMKRRQNKSDFKCDTCSKNFAKASSLKTHKMFNCEKKGKYCTLCKKLFATKEEKKQHWVEDHYKAMHRCYFCENNFQYKSYLASHMNFHTKETPFKCTNCSKRFLLPQYLDYHSMKLCRKNGKISE